MIRNYLKIAFRSLFKNKVTNCINIFGLSISMAAAVLVILWVQNELSFDNYHKGTAHLYRITNHVKVTNETLVWEHSPMPLIEYAKKEIPGVISVASFKKAYTPVMNVNGELFNQKNCVYIDSNWFQLFHFDFISGNPTSFFSSPRNMLLTESTAKKYFGNSDPIGKIIRIDTINYEVQGIVKDNPTNSSFQFEMILPLAASISNF